MSTNWKNEAGIIKREQAKPPPGGKTIEQIAEDMGESVDVARDIVQKLIAKGKAEMTRGKRMNAAEQLIPATYYRLIGKK